VTRLKKIIFLALSIFLLLSYTGCSKGTVETKQESNTTELKKITTKEVQEALNNHAVVVDARVNDAFTGWKIDGAIRGGHIKGATDFSAQWLRAEDDPKLHNKEKRLEDALKAKGITSEKNVIIYDSNGKDAGEVAKYFTSKGITKVSLYDFNQWDKDESLQLESYANYQMIVPPSYVKDIVDGKIKAKLFHASWGDGKEDYDKGHIKGSVHINTDEVEEGPVWNRKSDKQLEEFALDSGITVNDPVVIYGDDPTPSYRVAAILKYMGVKDVRVLNGGSTTWKLAGYDLLNEKIPKTKVASFGAKVPAGNRYIVDMPVAKEILNDKTGSILVDIRSWDEHIGKTKGYDDPNLKEAGRPKGSVWGHDLVDFRNVDNTMKNFNDVLAMWKANGITPDKRLAFFCGTGWRAAEVQVYADVAGLKNISLYDGGWYEWTMKGNNPFEKGEPQK
jgi:molybdopterin synthase sulfurtransferase